MIPDKGAAAEAIVWLSAGDSERDTLITGQVVLVIGNEPVRLALTVPAGPVATEDVLPILKGLSNLFADRAVMRAEAAGRTVSCRAGCGACCRQLVPVSAPEARALAHLVDAMPEPRRTRVRERFGDALAALETAGLLDRLSEPSDDGDRRALGLDYFRLGIACPFLEDEACSIHPDRPLSCREYLVTSPAPNCQVPSAETIDMVTLDSYPSRALLKADMTNGWKPLVLALCFSAQVPPPDRNRGAPEILRDVISQL